jgi:hypothetical protein
MRAAEQFKHGLFFVTGQAGISAFATVARPFLTVSGTDGQAGQQGSCDYYCEQPHGSILSVIN